MGILFINIMKNDIEKSQKYVDTVAYYKIYAALTGVRSVLTN